MSWNFFLYKTIHLAKICTVFKIVCSAFIVQFLLLTNCMNLRILYCFFFKESDFMVQITGSSYLEGQDRKSESSIPV